MKNYIVCAFFCILVNMSLPSSANYISEDSAKVKAEQLFVHKKDLIGKRLARGITRHEVSCVMKSACSDNEEPTYYIFKHSGDSGFAIIAGEDSMPALIGYSLDNTIDVDNMPEALKLMLNNYDLFVKSIRKNGKAYTKYNVGPIEPGTPIVGPYIQTTWSQYEPYNWLAPVDSKTGERMPSGCVPTAAAQILNYYKWPQNSYYRVYNWNAMLDSYRNNYSHTEGMAVATLMRDLGAIMQTSYATGGSSTSVDAYKKIPGYKYEKITNLQEGLAKGPLLISLSSELNHAVIVDGYDSTNLYHINWGWGGSCDGYYNLEDISIIYNDNEVHSSYNSKYTYLLKPDYENEKNITIPAALGGIDINLDPATIGDIKTITLHDLGLVSGNDFNGNLSCVIFKKSEKYGSYYSKKGVDGCTLFKDSDSKTVTPHVNWNNSIEHQDVVLSLTLGELPENGEYIIVPAYYNEKEKSGGWRMMLQFADETLNEDIPFEYKDGNYYFKEVTHGDFNINVPQIVTASTYREKGNSSILAFVENTGSNVFTGTITATLVNANNESDIKTVDCGLYAPAHQSNRMVLNTTFDFTGTYSIKDIEIWKLLPNGNRKTYFRKEINGTLFTILPNDPDAVTTNYYASANIDLLWRNDSVFVNNSIYRCEEASISFYVYPYNVADTVALEVELWAVPNEGKSYNLKNKSFPLSKSLSSKIGGSTTDIPLGDYVMVTFGRCGNNTTIVSQPDTIEPGSWYPKQHPQRLKHWYRQSLMAYQNEYSI